MFPAVRAESITPMNRPSRNTSYVRGVPVPLTRNPLGSDTGFPSAKVGLVPNTEVEFAVERGVAVLRPKQGVPTRARRLVDHLKTHGAKMRMSSRELLSLLREEPDELDPR